MSPELTAVLSTAAICVTLGVPMTRWAYVSGRRNALADHERAEQNRRLERLEEDRKRDEAQQRFASLLADAMRQDNT